MVTDMYGQDDDNYGAFNALADTLGAYIRSKSGGSGGAAGFGLGGAMPEKTDSLTSYGNDINSLMGKDIVSGILKNPTQSVAGAYGAQPAQMPNTDWLGQNQQQPQWYNGFNSKQLLMPVLKGYGR
jgi:hypothetical protein